MLTAVPGQITLTIAVDIQPPHHPPPDNRLLPDSCSYTPAAPSLLARQSNVDG
jgi:hypothetical protein